MVIFKDYKMEMPLIAVQTPHHTYVNSFIIYSVLLLEYLLPNSDTNNLGAGQCLLTMWFNEKDLEIPWVLIPGKIIAN